MRRLVIRVYGRVQGVFFRHSTRIKAGELGLKGFVRNEPDGSLYIEVEGREGALQEFLNWCSVGPPLAKVEKVDFEIVEAIGRFSEFEIK